MLNTSIPYFGHYMRYWWKKTFYPSAKITCDKFYELIGRDLEPPWLIIAILIQACEMRLPIKNTAACSRETMEYSKEYYQGRLAEVILYHLSPICYRKQARNRGQCMECQLGIYSIDTGTKIRIKVIQKQLRISIL